MRRRILSLAVVASTTCALGVAAPAQATPPMQTVALAPTPNTALVLGSSTGDFVPSLVASIAASVLLTLLVNSVNLGSSQQGDSQASLSSGVASGSGQSGSVRIKIKDS